MSDHVAVGEISFDIPKHSSSEMIDKSKDPGALSAKIHSEGGAVGRIEWDDDDLEDEESRNYVGFTDKTAAKNLTKQRSNIVLLI